MADKVAIEGWLLWRTIPDAGVDLFGVYSDSNEATRDIKLLRRIDGEEWFISRVDFIGFGIKREGLRGRVLSNKDPMPPTSGSEN
jgi:hypothetical protein